MVYQLKKYPRVVIHISVLVGICLFIGNSEAYSADSTPNVMQHEPRSTGEIQPIRQVSSIDPVSDPDSIPLKNSMMLNSSPLSVPGVADQHLSEVIEFAQTLAKNPIDINRDGIADARDEEFARTHFETALGIQGLPEDVTTILDRNHDFVFDRRDLDWYTKNLRGEIENLSAIREFSVTWNQDPVDLDQDGVVDLEDVEILSRELNRILSAPHLTQDVVGKLDQNGDGVVSGRDVNEMVFTVALHLRVMEALTDFANVLTEGLPDINQDGEINQRDVEDGLILYALAMVAPHLSLDVIETLDQDGDSVLTHRDMDLFTFRMECDKQGILLGDLDADYDVDIQDYLEFQLHYGSREGDKHYWARADLDGDGFIDKTDFSLFKTSFERFG